MKLHEKRESFFRYFVLFRDFKKTKILLIYYKKLFGIITIQVLS
jgi:hypothetical protein